VRLWVHALSGGRVCCSAVLDDLLTTDWVLDCFRRPSYARLLAACKVLARGYIACLLLRHGFIIPTSSQSSEHISSPSESYQFASPLPTMSPQASSSSAFVIPAIFTQWNRAPVEQDIEAQVVAGTHEQYSDSRVAAPPVALSRAPRTQPSPTNAEEFTNPIDDFFGVTRSRSSGPLRGTQDSRHDTTSLPIHHDDVPPPYSHAGNPPAYSRVAEHPTLAMYFFKFGFLFPLFWLAGAFILISPLRAPEEWELTKSEAERQEIIQSMRHTEVKWAKRCLIAFSLLAVVILVVVLAAIFSMRR